MQSSAPARQSCLALLAAAAVYFLDTFRLWFVRDDYAFLWEVRNLSLWERLRPHLYLNAWYRPLSRELHFSVLQFLSHDRPFVYHLVSFLLLAASVWLLYGLLRRLGAGTRGALLGAALWLTWPPVGLFLAWISSSQDLWAIALGLVALEWTARGRRGLAALAFLLALASKETALLFLPVAAALEWALGAAPGRAAWGQRWMGLAAVAWAAVHPLTRIVLAEGHVPAGLLGSVMQVSRLPAPLGGLLAGLGSLLRLDLGLAPLGALGAVPWSAWLGLAGIVAACAAGREAAAEAPAPGRRALVFWGLFAALGLIPILPASSQLHASYAALAALGFAGLAGSVLARVPRAAAVFAVAALGILGVAVRYVPQSDFYTEWSTRQEERAQSHVRQWLRTAIPAPEPGTEFYFLKAPVSSGLFARHYGNRLLSLPYWYADSSLRAYLIPEYRRSVRPHRFILYREAPRAPLLLAPDAPVSLAAGDTMDWLEGQYRVTRALTSGGNFDEAAGRLEAVESVRPNHADLWTTRARLAMAAGRAPEFLSAVAEAKARMPNSPEVLFLSAVAAVVDGERDLAAKLARLALAAAPSEEARAEARTLLKRLDEAP